MPKEKKNCTKRWRGGLKKTIELMLIRPPQLQFFEEPEICKILRIFQE